MKLSTTLATVSALAIAGWASAPGAPAVGPTAVPLPFFQAACPTPAAANPKPGWKHGEPEYKDFTAAASATDNAQKAQLAAAFIQKYPDSDYKVQAMQVEFSAQAQTPGQQAQAVQTAEALIKSGSADAAALLPAYTVIAYLDPQLLQSSDPDLATKNATLLQAATCGQQLLASATAAQQAQFGPILTKAEGFAQLNAKQNDAAIATLTKVVQQNPKDSLSYYWMGIAEVTKATPDLSSGLFYLAKAAVLAPNTPTFKEYFTKVYTDYHGDTTGIDDVTTAATNSAAPPDGYHIMSKVDLENKANMDAYNAQVEAQKNALPPEDSFPGLMARLKRPDLAADFWKKTKGNGLELQGLVTAVTAKTVDVAVGATDASAPANVRLVLAAPLTKHLKVGENVTIDGVPESFKPNPPDPSVAFVLTLSQGSVKGYSPEAK